MKRHAIFVLVVVTVVCGFFACKAEATESVLLAGDLEVVPLDDFESMGEPGGPFTPSFKDYQLTNVGPNSIYWGIAKTADWLDFDSDEEGLYSMEDFESDLLGPLSTWGQLEPNESVTVTASLNAIAETLGVGIHTDTLTFTDITHEAEETRGVTLMAAFPGGIWVSPTYFDVNIPEGCSLTEMLTIGNSGTEDLNFTIQTHVVAGSGESVEGTGGASTEAAGRAFSVPKGHDFTVLGNAPYSPGELIVRFAPKAGGVRRSTAEKNQILGSMGGGAIKRNFKIVPDLSVVKLPAGRTVEKALKSFNKTKGILYAEPNYEVKAISTFPDDPRFDELWGMHNTGQSGGTADADIDAPEAWDIATGSGEIVVAVIDTGVDYTHPDLAANMWVNEGEIPGNGIDDDGNGYIDDVYGYDFRNDDGNPIDDHYHGTHCAGTIGALGDNGEGVAGVCWDVRIMAVKFLSSSGSGSTEDAISSVEYTTLMGANLSSNSWGGGGYSQGLKDAIEAAGAAGMLFIASAGNDNVNTDTNPHYPSSYDSESLISVMSTDRNDNKSSFSNWGPTSVDLGAPGSDILSCEPGGGYRYASGTSMAGPHVAGACALLWSMNPAMSNDEVKDILLETADEIPALSGKCVSEGRLNLYNGILETRAPWIVVEPEAGTVAPGDANDVNVTFDAMELVPGTYEAEIIVISDDPCNPEVTVPATMTVNPDDLVVTPVEGFEPNGVRGGPFAPQCTTYTLTNNGTEAVSWMTYPTEDWLAVDPCEGVLEPNESVDVNVCLTPAADLLDPNVYTESLTFENINSGSIKMRSVTLTVEPPDCFTKSFDGGVGLGGLMLTFMPDGSTAYYEACREEIGEFPTDPNGATYVSLGDDDFVEVVLTGGAEVLFYGSWYDRFYIGSNGYITFGAGDTEYSGTLEDHFDMPRISALFTDLTPADNQSISWMQLADRVVVTFKDVPIYGDKNAKSSFQVEMFFVDGTICMSWLDIAASAGVAGLSEGYGLPPDFTESDLGGYPPCWPFCDLNRDYVVGWGDVDMFVSHWLDVDCNIPYWCGRADFDFSSAIDMFDWAIFAENWLTEIEKWWLQPVAHWKFDEGEGTIAYDSAGDNDGNLVGDPYWVTGKIGPYALDFDGVDDYVVVPDSDSISVGNKNYTICAWIHPVSVSGHKSIVSKVKGGADKEYNFCTKDGAIKLGVEKNSNNQNAVTTGAPVTAGAWQYVAVTFDSVTTTPTFYYNGQYEDATNLINTLPDELSDDLYIGMIGGEYFDDHFDGTIDDVRIYDRVLSAEEVWELYLEGVGEKASNPYPGDGVVDVEPDVVLSWSPGYGAVSHDVYLGTDYNDVNDADVGDPNVYMGNQTATSYDPNGLDLEMTCYWRIDEVDDSNDRCKGDVWSFTTYGEPNSHFVGWWKFDEGSGTDANDSSGNGNDGTLYGDPQWVAGKIGSYALDFDGVDDYVVVPDSDSISVGNKNYTICAWIHPVSVSGLNSIVSKVKDGADKEYYFWIHDGIIKLGVEKNSNNQNAVTTGAPVTAGAWQYVAVTFDSVTTTPTFYYNGQYEDATNLINTLPDELSDDLYIGMLGGEYFDRHFDGTIDDVRIYDRVLSAEEVWELYLEGVGENASNPYPADGAVDVEPDVVLSWSPGYGAVSHDVYFGTDYNDVNEADVDDPNVYMGNQTATSYDPNGLDLETTYYWRIDEVDDSNDRYKGDVWSFTTYGEPNSHFVGWWKFDEGSGTDANDSSGNGNHGTVYGAVWTSGQIDGALNFDGTDDYVGLPDNEPIWLPQYNFTLSAWVYFEGDVSSVHECILDLNHGDSAESSNELGYRIERRKNDGKLTFYMTTTTNPDEDLASNDVLVKDTWYHVVAVRDGTTQAVYIDGLSNNDRTCSPGPIDFVGVYDDDKVNIGKFSRNGYPDILHLDGTIDDARIYDRALTAGEIWQLYQQGMGEKASNPYPADGVVDVEPDVVLSWSPGYGAVSHDVYFGTDYDDVNDADISDPNVYMGNQTATSYDPNGLDLEMTYYWRIDEVDDFNDRCKGDVWSFTTRAEFDPNLGLVGWWKLDEGSGTDANDSSGNGNHGTLYGDPQWVTGKVGDYALDFDGEDDYVDVPLTLNLSNAWTISIWLKSNEMTPGSPFNLGGSYYSGKISIESRDDYGYGGFRFRYAANGTGSVINTGIVNEGNWHHIVWYQEGGSINSAYAVYVDGQLVNETIVPQAKYATVPFRIAWEGSFGYFNGTIDDVRIYDRALTAGEIWQLYQQGLGEKAFNPYPADGAVDVEPDVVVSWSPGYGAVSHDVYFGTDYNDVNDADVSDPNVYMGNQEPNSWDPNGLEYETVYYWRIDEVDDSNDKCKGDVWSFTTLAEFDPNLGLVGWWRFDEGSGTDANDSSGYGNDGTLYGDPNWVTGNIGSYALDFDGVGDYVQIPDDNSLTPSSEITIAYWLYNRGGQDAGIFKYAACPSEAGSPGASRAYLMTVIDSTGKLRLRIFAPGDNSDIIDSNNTVTLDQWHYVAGTFDEGEAAVYIDGQLDNSAIMSVSSIWNDAQPLIIGGYWEYCGADSFLSRLNGKADEVRVYDRALTAGEIWQLYQQGDSWDIDGF